MYNCTSRPGHGINVWVGLTPLQRRSLYILLYQSNGPHDNRWMGSYLSAEMQLYIQLYEPTRPRDKRWGRSYSFAVMQFIYTTVSVDWAT